MLELELRDPTLVASSGRPVARARAKLRYVASDSTMTVGEWFRITTGPASMEEDISWYLERWALWPSEPLRARAEHVETQWAVWGRWLWGQIDIAENRRAIGAWRRASERDGDRGLELTIRLVGQDDADTAAEAATRCLALPWELLHDDAGFLMRRDGGLLVRRQGWRGAPRAEARDGPRPAATPLRLLIVSPRPEDSDFGYFDHRASALPLIEALAPLGRQAVLDLLEPPTFSALVEALERASDAGAPYHVVHFDGHGVVRPERGGHLVFEHEFTLDMVERRLAHEVSGRELASVLRQHQVPLVFLDACQSASGESGARASIAVQLLSGGVGSIVAMTHSVLLETARRFVAVFYRTLLAGERVGTAVRAGQRALADRRYRRRTLAAGELELTDWFVPVLYQRAGDHRLIRERQRAPGSSTLAAAADLEPDIGNRWVGRSRELLILERRLLTQRYAVVVGMAGEGKSALVREQARWLLATGRSRRVVTVQIEPSSTVSAVLDDLLTQLGADVATGHGPSAEARLDEALRQVATVILIEQCEALLPPVLPDLDAARGLSSWLGRLLGLGRTQLLLTSRLPLVSPFDAGPLLLGPMDEASAVALLGRSMTERAGERQPGEPSDALGDLATAASRHAQTLDGLADLLADRGGVVPSDPYEWIAEVYAPADSEQGRRPHAVVDGAIHRATDASRRALRGLTYVRAGGLGVQWAEVLGVDRDEAEQLAWELVQIGLARWPVDGFFTLHPGLIAALGRSSSDEDLTLYRQRWLEACIRLASYLYRQQMRDTPVAERLTALAKSDLLAGLERLRDDGRPETLVDYADSLEHLFSAFGYQRALRHVRAVREAAAARLVLWDHARHVAATAAVLECLEAGRAKAAIDLARQAVAAIDEVEGDDSGLIYDRAEIRFYLAQALLEGAQPAEALPWIEQARESFDRLAASGNREARRMIWLCTAMQGDCRLALGRFDEAADTLQRAASGIEEFGDKRQLAAVQSQLGTALLEQGRHLDALAAYQQARDGFESVHEMCSVAIVLHQVGRAHELGSRWQKAEAAYQQSLMIKVELGALAGQAKTLLQLGNLVAMRGRFDEAAQAYARAAELGRELDDGKTEAASRTNLADVLRQLDRFADARAELDRAIELQGTLGFVAEPWSGFAVLSELEIAVGDPGAAQAARERARVSYRSYLDGGGQTRFPGGRLCAFAWRAFVDGPLDELRQGLAGLRREADLPNGMPALVTVLERLLEGERDLALADDPRLFYADAVEVGRLLEKLVSLADERPSDPLPESAGDS